MSEEIEQDSTELDLTVSEQESSPETTATTQTWVVVLLILCLLACAGLAAALYYLSQQGLSQLDTSSEEIQQLSSEVDQRLSAVDELHALTEEVQQASNQQQQLVAEIKTKQESLEQTVTALSATQPDSNLEWALAEIEQLIVIAVHQLQLAENVGAAKAALQAADDRIRGLAEPGLFAVREQLTSDINALNAINPVDISGMSLYLSDLINRVSTLPLKESAVVPETESVPPTEVTEDSLAGLSWQEKLKRLPTMIWNELKTLLVINYDEEAGSAFILPQQEYYLYQNLRLQLEHARFSVLAKDNANLQSSVEQISQWLTLHFNTEDAAVENVLTSLTEMKEVDLRPGLPDLTSSLESLRAYQRQQGAGQ